MNIIDPTDKRVLNLGSGELFNYPEETILDRIKKIKNI